MKKSDLFKKVHLFLKVSHIGTAIKKGVIFFEKSLFSYIKILKINSVVIQFEKFFY